MVGLLGIGTIGAVSTLRSKTSATMRKSGQKIVAPDLRIAAVNTESTKTFKFDNGNEGLAVGTSVNTAATGIVGSAFSFSGTGDPSCTVNCILGTDDNSIDAGLGSISVGVWAKSSSGQGTMVRKSDGSNANGWILEGLSTAQFRVGFNGGAGVSASGSYNDNQWHFVVGVLDRPNAELRIYVDGVLKGTSSAASLAGVDLNPSAPLMMNTYNSAPFTLDEPMFWNKPLTDDDVELIYQSVG